MNKGALTAGPHGQKTCRQKRTAVLFGAPFHFFRRTTRGLTWIGSSYAVTALILAQVRLLSVSLWDRLCECLLSVYSSLIHPQFDWGVCSSADSRFTDLLRHCTRFSCYVCTGLRTFKEALRSNSDRWAGRDEKLILGLRSQQWNVLQMQLKEGEKNVNIWKRDDKWLTKNVLSVFRCSFNKQE